MTERGWIQKLTEVAQVMPSKTLFGGMVMDAGLQYGAASFRRSLFGAAESPTTKYALYAWLARVIQTARKRRNELAHFHADTLNAEFLRELAQLSWSDQGPLLAIEFLQKHGIAVVIEPQLKGTQLDGAALKDVLGEPIIGLTLRHDRLDNFWFTLLHEVAHLWHHVDGDEVFLDDLDVTTEDRKEAEANRLAREAFIPRLIWKRSDAYMSPSRESARQTIARTSHSPGHYRWQAPQGSGRNYQVFSGSCR